MSMGEIGGKKRASLHLARLKKEGETFEISIDADKAIAFRNGEDISVREILEVEQIFSDAQKGMIAPADSLRKVFETEDTIEVAERILKTGEVQLTSEYRDQLREQKRKRLVDLIHRNGVDPQGRPHPPQRIENAIAEAKAQIDDNKSAEDQLADVVKQIQTVLPIRFETRKLEVVIPAEHAGKAYSVLKNYGTLEKDEWQNDGSLFAVVSMPAGLAEDFESQLNSITHGNVEIKQTR